MKLIILACVVVAVAIAAPPELRPEPVKIIRSDFQQNPDGGYTYSFESEDGTKRQETGVLKEVRDEENKPHLIISVRGYYSYKNLDGEDEIINYSADENGYTAEGDSIPKAANRR